MSLKLTRRAGSPFWWLTGTIEGQRIRESTGTADERIAGELRSKRELDIHRVAIHGAPKRVVTFDEALVSYLEEESRPAGTKKQLIRIRAHLGGGTPCNAIDQEALDGAARALLKPGFVPATKLRQIVSPVRAVLTHAAVRGWCAAPTFKMKVRGKARTEWLTPFHLDALLAHASDTLRPLLTFLAGTGARMGDAVRLEWADVDLTHARARLRGTKNGDDRQADLPPRVVAVLAALDGRKGRVFRDAAGAPYKDARDTGSGGQIRRPWATACAAAGLPGRWTEVKHKDWTQKRFEPDHTPHSLRHTWATYQYAMHRDLLRLKADGGWRTVAMCERYAKLAPPGMEVEIRAWMTLPAEASGNGERAVA